MTKRPGLNGVENVHRTLSHCTLRVLLPLSLALLRRYEPGKIMYNMGNFNHGEDVADDFPLPPTTLTLNDAAHPMRLNWCGIINEDEFIWFQLTKM
jgi:hypothetical protein